MPGFLGTERQFAARYGKPILASRDAKSSSREQEAGMSSLLHRHGTHFAHFSDGRMNRVGLPAGVLAMEALHRQVLPFLLRRMKEDVLQDLPPKIIQDYYCNLSPLQVLMRLLSPGWNCWMMYSVFPKTVLNLRLPEKVLIKGAGLIL